MVLWRDEDFRKVLQDVLDNDCACGVYCIGDVSATIDQYGLINFNLNGVKETISKECLHDIRDIADTLYDGDLEDGYNNFSKCEKCFLCNTWTDDYIYNQSRQIYVCRDCYKRGCTCYRPR